MGKIFTDPFGIKEAQRKQEEAQGRAQEEARKQAEEATAREVQRTQEAKGEQARLEEKFGRTPEEIEREKRAFELEKQRQGELQRRAGLPGEELLREAGPTTAKLLDQISGRVGLSADEAFLRDTGTPGRQFFDEVTGGDTSLFKQELDVVLGEAKKELNRRGLGMGVIQGGPDGVSTGIGFEHLGRAGVDLAIKRASERIEQRKSLANAILSLSQNIRAEAGIVGESSLKTSDQARSELEGFLKDLQTLDVQAKSREQGGTLGAADIASGQIQQARGFSEGVLSESSAINQDIFGQQFGQAATREQAGRDTLGNLIKIGATAIGTAVGNPAAGMAAGAGAGSFTEREPEEELFLRRRGLTGSSINDEELSRRFSSVRRR